MGFPCTFYHEGGHGLNYWARGWRYGFIIETPIKGQHKNWTRVEVRVPLYGLDETGRYKLRPFERAWVRSANVNAPMDFVYHGPRLNEIVQERQEDKAEQQAEANALRLPKPTRQPRRLKGSQQKQPKQSAKKKRAA